MENEQNRIIRGNKDIIQNILDNYKGANSKVFLLQESFFYYLHFSSQNRANYSFEIQKKKTPKKAINQQQIDRKKNIGRQSKRAFIFSAILVVHAQIFSVKQARQIQNFLKNLIRLKIKTGIYIRTRPLFECSMRFWRNRVRSRALACQLVLATTLSYVVGDKTIQCVQERLDFTCFSFCSCFYGQRTT